MIEINKPLNLAEAADYLHIKQAYLYNLVHYRKITAYKPGGKLLLFKQEDLEKYAFSNKRVGSNELINQADEILLNRKTKRDIKGE